MSKTERLICIILVMIIQAMIGVSNAEQSDYLFDPDETFDLDETGVIDLEIYMTVPYKNNDAWHYGRMTDREIDSSLTVQEAVALLDADGWACTKIENAELYDAPQGTVLATCFCRVPGMVIAQMDGWTQLQIGSDDLGLKGWFHSEDLAFGAGMEEIICSFPSYEFLEFPDETAFEKMIEDKLGTSFYCCDAWLIAKKSDGDWLMLINQQMVCTPPANQMGETWPTEHAWDESTWHEWPDE